MNGVTKSPRWAWGALVASLALASVGIAVTVVDARVNGWDRSDIVIILCLVAGTALIGLLLREYLSEAADYRISERGRVKAEGEFRALFEESQDAVFISSRDGRFVDVNPAMVTLLGYASREALLAADIARDVYVHPEDRDAFVNAIQAHGFVRGYALELKRTDGTVIDVLESATAVRDECGEVVAVRGILHDITERRRLEVQLRHAQRLETIGTLAGGVAHDFNNLLTVILGNALFAKDSLKATDPARRPLQQVEAAVEQARKLPDQLLGLSRRQPYLPKVLDLNLVVQDLLKLLGRVLGEHIKLDVDLGASPGRIVGDAGQIQQVLMNLCTNARDAMPGGGLLALRTRQAPAADAAARGLAPGEVREFVEISVQDSGQGMDPEVRQRIFDPFFTTKETGKGTGLGLWVVHGIVQQHGGLIDVDSTPGRGTIFRLLFPAAPPSTGAEAGAAIRGGAARGGPETILLAEDEEQVRGVAEQILRRLGYRVLLAPDGESAVRLLEREGRSVDLAVLDVVMPTLGGPEAYRRMRAKQPDLHALFVTGYDLRAELDELLKDRSLPVDLLQKPYSASALAAKVRELLDLRASRQRPPTSPKP